MNKEEYVKMWIQKADGNMKVSKRELETDDPVLDAVCFHLQQAVEKYVKAYLANCSEEIKKTHNLEFLLEQCIKIDKDFQEFEEKFDQIADCGVAIRYPDNFIVLDKEQLDGNLIIVRKFREFILDKIDSKLPNA